MKNFKIVFLFLFFPSIIIVSCTSRTTDSVTFQNVLESFYFENPDLIGIMVHIEAPDKNISWSGAVGLSDKNDTIKIDPDQPMLIASNTKTYVSAAILRLVEQGKLSLNSAIDTLISETSQKILSNDGYNLKNIQIKHLLSHTSGIFDYNDSKTMSEKVNQQPDYKWTRAEQIKLAADEGEPLAEPAEMFKYSDTNYLLLTEIIEKLTGKVFYTSMRELLKFDQFDLSNTWFYSLEDSLVQTKPLIYQYNRTWNTSTKTESPTFDLYGGGGLATTTSDLAIFTHLLFTGKIFDNPETSNLLYTRIETKEPNQSHYMLGIKEFEIMGETVYGHSGFWGTATRYFPEENITFSVSLSNTIDRDKDVEKLLEKLLEELKDL